MLFRGLWAQEASGLGNAQTPPLSQRNAQRHVYEAELSRETRGPTRVSQSALRSDVAFGRNGCKGICCVIDTSHLPIPKLKGRKGSTEAPLLLNRQLRFRSHSKHARVAVAPVPSAHSLRPGGGQKPSERVVGTGNGPYSFECTAPSPLHFFQQVAVLDIVEDGGLRDFTGVEVGATPHANGGRVPDTEAANGIHSC